MATVTVSTPHPSSTLVNISDDADLRLIHVLAPCCTSASSSNPSAFEEECNIAIGNSDAAQLLRTVISHGTIRGLLTNSSFSVGEVVSVFSLLTVYLDRVGDAAVEKELCSALANSVVVAGGDGADNDDEPDDEDAAGKRRAKQSAMVASLFNLRTNADEKVNLLAKVVELADISALTPGESRGASALADMLEPTTLQSTLKLWGNVAEEEGGGMALRALYAAVVGGMDRVLGRLTKDGGKEDKTVAVKITATKERKQTYLLRFLETYTDESQLDDQARKYACEASVYAISDPINLFSTQRRILSLPAVSALSKLQPALYDLLKIFMEGKLQDYRDFNSMPDKMTVFSTFRLDEKECMKNMSLLSLVSLAGEHEEIPYGAIASTLNISEEEVEHWVIRAVSSGLMEAKMDQLRKVVLVERCAARQFGMKEWTALKIRLDTWKSNVRGVLDELKKSGAATAVDGQ